MVDHMFGNPKTCLKAYVLRFVHIWHRNLHELYDAGESLAVDAKNLRDGTLTTKSS